MRYRIGFPDKRTKCDWVERNPGFIPIVDVAGPWILGRVVCLCESPSEATLICDLLNLSEIMKQAGWSKP